MVTSFLYDKNTTIEINKKKKTRFLCDIVYSVDWFISFFFLNISLCTSDFLHFFFFFAFTLFGERLVAMTAFTCHHCVSAYRSKYIDEKEISSRLRGRNSLATTDGFKKK